MKGFLLVPVTAALLAFGSPAALAGEFKQSDAPAVPDTSSTTRSNTNIQPVPVPAPRSTPSTDKERASTTVIVSSSGFSPSHITVPVGTTVTWVNQDTVFQSVTSTVSGGPDSNRMFPGKSYSFTFRHAGTFPYFSRFCPDLVGSVTVTGETPKTVAPSTTTSPPPAKQSTTTTTTRDSSAGSSTSSSNATATNNTFVSVEPPQNTTTSTPPAAAKSQPVELPATGASDTVILFGAAAAVGAIFYNVYSYVRKKLTGNL